MKAQILLEKVKSYHAQWNSWVVVGLHKDRVYIAASTKNPVIVEPRFYYTYNHPDYYLTELPDELLPNYVELKLLGEVK